MNMVEQVARAIALDRAEPWNAMPDHEKLSWLETSRMAIRAMHDPTDAMVGAAYAVGPTISSAEREPAKVWRAMVNTALLEEHLP